jgi:isoaspartyl peptidase/L-asparaginase-like protein (Ntn-hydrolase superfamily)
LPHNPVVVATWPFGLKCAEAARAVLCDGGDAVDAVERGARIAEADASIGSVGYGGLPNRDGVVQVDAAIMSGPGHRAGSVCALEGFKHAVSVARRVMEVSPHVMLAGAGASQFALDQGFEKIAMLTDNTRHKWEAWCATEDRGFLNHHSDGKEKAPDTVGVLAVDGDGNLAASCSTSGAAYKHPGRVGDSPILGSGLYCDQRYGAAAATGLGEDIMRYCVCYEVVAAMGRGLSPAEACRVTLEAIRDYDPKGIQASVFMIALNPDGEAAGDGMSAGFPYAVIRGDTPGEVLHGEGVELIGE